MLLMGTYMLLPGPEASSDGASLGMVSHEKVSWKRKSHEDDGWKQPSRILGI
jgi:hypothetical protein